MGVGITIASEDWILIKTNAEKFNISHNRSVLLMTNAILSSRRPYEI